MGLKIKALWLKTNYYLFIISITQNVKAYFRRGTSREMLGYYKEAIEGKIFSFGHFIFASYYFIRKIEKEYQCVICGIILKRSY